MTKLIATTAIILALAAPAMATYSNSGKGNQGHSTKSEGPNKSTGGAHNQGRKGQGKGHESHGKGEGKGHDKDNGSSNTPDHGNGGNTTDSKPDEKPDGTGSDDSADHRSGTEGKRTRRAMPENDAGDEGCGTKPIAGSNAVTQDFDCGVTDQTVGGKYGD